MINETKQTAVDWLFLNLKSHFEHDGDLLEAVQMSYEQAKEMHKEEIINIVVWCDDTDRRPQQIKIEAEQYYNDTYGGNKIQCQCQFEMDTSTSSATKCKFCGKEKWQHINGGNK
jgi:hypothetical protein